MVVGEFWVRALTSKGWALKGVDFFRRGGAEPNGTTDASGDLL